MIDRVAVVAWCLLATTPAHAGPAWKVDRVSEVQVRDAEFVVRRVVTDRTELGSLLGCFARANKVGEHHGGHKWTHRIDVRGETPDGGRWLYDSSSGEFARLTKAVTPIYRLEDADKARVENLLPVAPGNSERSRPLPRQPQGG